MTRDPKRVSLVEWYQEMVDRVFLNYQPPQKKQEPSQVEEPAENEAKKVRDASGFCGMPEGLSLDGAA